jgi:hypothetical protein
VDGGSTKSNSNSSPSQVVIVIFWQKIKKKSSPTVPHLKLPFIQVGKNQLRAHICAQQYAVHPRVLEEVEGYKNNFVFSQDS